LESKIRTLLEICPLGHFFYSITSGKEVDGEGSIYTETARSENILSNTVLNV